MELICVRHGRTAWNAERRFQGQTDIPLDDEGRAQAQALAAHLRGERFDLALTSDLSRAVATAEAICAGRELLLERDPELREMGFGIWEGLTWPEIVASDPSIDYSYEKSPRHYTPEGGESWDALVARVDAALQRICRRTHDGGRILLVSHAGVMHAIVHAVTRTAEGADNEAAVGIRFTHGSILRVHGSFERGWELAAVNETPGAVGARRAS